MSLHAILCFLLMIAVATSRPFDTPPGRPSFIYKDHSDERHIILTSGRVVREIEADQAEIRASVDSQHKIGDFQGDLNSPENSKLRSDIIFKVQNDVSSRVDDIFSFLKSSKDVSKLHTTSIRLDPLFRWDSKLEQNFLHGYAAQSSISFKVPARESGKFISAILEKGATKIQDILFSPSESAHAAARKQAISDACQDAYEQAVASLTGLGISSTPEVLHVTVDDVSSPVSSNPSGVVYRFEAKAAPMAMADVVAPTPVEAGTSTVEAKCSLKLKYRHHKERKNRKHSHEPENGNDQF